MRILQVVGGLNRGGAETGLMHILRHIDRKKYQIDFLVHTVEPCQYDEEAQSLGARIIPCLTPSRPVMYARNFFRVLRQYGPYDVVHSHVHYFSGYIMALAMLAGVPQRIVHSHSQTLVVDERASLPRRCYVLCTAALIRILATKGIGVCDLAAANLFGVDWRSHKKFSVSHLGIDMEPFRVPLNRSDVRQALGIDEGDFVVGHVGRFCEPKNHDFLLDVGAELVKREPRTLLLLVGDGPLRPRIKSKIRRLGLEQRVKLLGVKSDVPRILRGAMDAFVFPSLYEGFPLALIEAQAAGLPCIVSDRFTREATVTKELVTTLSLNDSPAAWAECTLKSRHAQRRDTGVSEHFSSAASAERLCRYYQVIDENVTHSS
jgi:glycosyltransferase involved in cell wall biosynthesis